MTMKERIQAEIESLGEEHLDELYALIKHFTQSKRSIGQTKPLFTLPPPRPRRLPRPQRPAATC